MSEDQQSNSRWSGPLDSVVVFAGSELIAFPFCFEGAVAALAGDWQQFFIAYAVGLPFAIIGLTYPLWKRRVAAFKGPLIAALLVLGVTAVFVFVLGPDIYRRATQPVTNAGQIAAVPSNLAAPPPEYTAQIQHLQALLNDANEKLRRLNSAPITGASRMKTPILGLDDAERFQLIKKLRDDTYSGQGGILTCHAMAHARPKTKWADAIWAEIEPILKYASWQIEGGRSEESDFPPGFTLSVSADAGDAFNCAYRLSETLTRLSVPNRVRTNRVTPDLISCEKENPRQHGCVMMMIGDEN